MGARLTTAFALLALCALLHAAPAVAGDYYVVVSEGNPVRRLTQQQALHLFMGRTRSFPDGSLAKACEPADDAQRAGFYRALGDMSLAQVTSYWARLMFSGRSLPPQRIDSEAGLMEKIRQDPHAIGWLSAPPTQPGLRTVLVLKGRP